MHAILQGCQATRPDLISPFGSWHGVTEGVLSGTPPTDTLLQMTVGVSQLVTGRAHVDLGCQMDLDSAFQHHTALLVNASLIHKAGFMQVLLSHHCLKILFAVEAAALKLLGGRAQNDAAFCMYWMPAPKV